jgi:hypothetical protein
MDVYFKEIIFCSEVLLAQMYVLLYKRTVTQVCVMFIIYLNFMSRITKNYKSLTKFESQQEVGQIHLVPHSKIIITFAHVNC